MRNTISSPRQRAIVFLSCIAGLVLCAGCSGDQPEGLSADTKPLPLTDDALSTQPDGPPFTLSLAQLRAFSPNENWVEPRNRSRTPLSPRVEQFGERFDPPASSALKVLYAPDGMNNFGNYIEPRTKFNHYTFTQWSGIDVLNWFSSGAVSIPSRPWVEAAHRNGVKVLGTIFFAPVVYSGTSEKVADFFRPDSDGGFSTADKLIEVAEYYGFDGWLINQETDIPDLKGKPGGPDDILAFMKHLTAAAPDGMEIHWYDSMIASGEVKWQNELNEKNALYLHDMSDDQPSAHAMFLNYWWNGEMAFSTATTAEALGRSRYDAYLGADLWPQRTAQAAYKNLEWLDLVFPERAPQGLGSIALFAPNFMYNFGGDENVTAFSTFTEEEGDVDRFYREQNRLFAGDDLNAAQSERPKEAVWQGLSAYLPMRSSIVGKGFETTFNTGHGRYRFEKGARVEGAWHNMSEQDIMPTWQFAALGGGDWSLHFDFDHAYVGGSSLYAEYESDDPEFTMPLYRTSLDVPNGVRFSATYQYVGSAGSAAVCLHGQDGALRRVVLDQGADASDDITGWVRVERDLKDENALNEIRRIDLCPATVGDAAPASVRIGALSLSPIDRE